MKVLYRELDLVQTGMKIESILKSWDLNPVIIESLQAEHACFHHIVCMPEPFKFFMCLGIQLLLKDNSSPELAIFYSPDKSIDTNDLVDYFLSKEGENDKIKGSVQIMCMGSSSSIFEDMVNLRPDPELRELLIDLMKVYRIGCTHGFYEIDNVNEKMKTGET